MTNPSDREVAVFNAALQLPAGKRAAFLDEQCATDNALRLRVEGLLRVHDEVGTFLENPTQEAGPSSSAAGEASGASGKVPLNTSSSEKPGDRIGRYKLLQQIGEGGCGVVYMAAQSEPVRRKVALKVIKLGMDTRNVIARFEAERQALALMDHPNIAKVFDAGATETGRPFFVMELVRGIKITEYCDENHLATEQRLKLFTQVCLAIQHAHQKGIIHRDIKPSNILVADHDGVPVPKVIDFGIAKATTDQPLTDKTLFTALEQFMGTPAYMSPEQARLSGLDIDARTDIYSLGVLLYELLTGKTPFDAKALVAAGLEEMRRTIREKEPTRPSTALSTMLADDLTTVARRRQSDAPKLLHLVRGDLDWIVMKCLEKDRTRRYATVNGLAFDIQRHLNDEPVNARPPSNGYRMQKLMRRHRGAFAAGFAVAGTLLAGLVASTCLYLKESTAHQRALAAERTAETARQSETSLRQRAEEGERTARQAQQLATDELWRSYLAQARAARFSGQPGRRFDSLALLAKAAAIRSAPELRDEAIACLALADLKLEHRIEAHRGVFDGTLARYAMVGTNAGDISIRQTSDDRELFRLPNSAGIVKWIGRFSRDGKMLPVCCLDDRLRLWDLDHRSVVLTVPFDRSVDLAFAPDGQTAAVVSGASEVSIYHLTADAKLASFPTTFAPRYVRYDPAGRRIAISSPFANQVTILDASSGASLLVLTNAEGFSDLAWHPRENILAAACHDGLIYLWDTADGRLLHALKGHDQMPGEVAFGGEGEILISAGWDGTRLWHAYSGELFLHTQVAASLLQPARDGRGLGYTRFDPPHSLEDNPSALQELEVVSMASGREAGRWRANEQDTKHKVQAFSPDGRWLAFGARDFVELYETRTGVLLATLPTGAPLGVCFQKVSGNLLVSGERGLFRWPRQTGADGSISLGPPEQIGPGAWQQISLSENGQIFAAFHGNRVQILEGESLRKLAEAGPCGQQKQFRYISLSPDGKWLATGGWHDASVKIWDARTGAAVKELADPDWAPDGCPYPAFDPGGHGLLIAFGENYRLWETNFWTPGLRVPRSDWGMMGVSHRSGVVALRQDGTAVQLRDVASGEVLATLQSPVSDTVTELAFSPDDTQLAVAHNMTRELVVWDLRLLREQLAKIGMDWARPPYQLATNVTAPPAAQVRVLTNAFSAMLRSP